MNAPTKMADSKVHAPYNFVPLSGKVVLLDHEEGHAITHDIPFSDGIDGFIEVELEAQTPLCVGSRHGSGQDQGDRIVEPFRTPGGELAIPGTSIKGMLRNVIEIVSFSRMQFVDRERRYAVRDLRNRPLYLEHMTTRTPSGSFKATPLTGWLEIDPQKEEGADGRWRIVPCKMSRVEQAHLIALNAAAEQALTHEFTSRSTPSAKYDAWLSGIGTLDIQFDPGSMTDHGMSRGNGKLHFSLANNVGTGATTGRLVMTGQASANKRLDPSRRQSKGKHREFVFYDADENRSIPIPHAVRENFELNHAEDQGERHGGQVRPNKEWKYWKDKLENGERVPVFFLSSGDRLASFGLTQMYRLAYKYSIGDAVDRASIDHCGDPGAKDNVLAAEYKLAKADSTADRAMQLDFAESIFGYTRSHKSGGAAMAGRVNVGLFRCTSGDVVNETFTGILNGAKPTYYPAYVDQAPRMNDAADAELKRPESYLTFMDDEAEVRGWKRYPVRPRHTAPSTPDPKQKNVTVTWNAVGQGTKYKGRIYFHNMRAHEVGAVVWAIRFGDDDRLWHSLGYAKPFGFGAVKLRVLESRLTGSLRDREGQAVDLERAREDFSEAANAAIGRFVDDMSQRIGLEGSEAWDDLEQVVQLRGMADRDNASHRNLDYMLIAGGGPGRGNQFVDAKGSARNGDSSYVLPRYVKTSVKTDRSRFPRSAKSVADLWNDRIAPVRKRIEDRKAQEQAEEEAKRLNEMSAENRLRETRRDWLDLELKEQVDKLLAMPREVPSTDAADPAAWAAAWASVFPAAMKEIERRANAGGSSKLADFEKQLADLGDPPAKTDRRYKSWRNKRDRLEKKIGNIRDEVGRESEASVPYREFLEWLRYGAPG